jgi:hypothetical protein
MPYYSTISPHTAEPPALWQSSELADERRSVMPNVTKPKYTRGEVDRAGDGIIAQDIVGTPARNEALTIVSNWRSSHGYPTQSYHLTLLKRATSVDRYATVAQRLKRLPSIEAKLRRSRPSDDDPKRPKMQLTQMQDIGGCRAILKEWKHVRKLVNYYKNSRYTRNIFKENDYVSNPKSDGYRCVHLVYKFHPESTHDSPYFNNMRVELQFRSELQHLWATGVEIVDTFTEEALKFGRGGNDWRRFFALMSTDLAMREQMPLVPGTPTNRSELKDELQELTYRLHVLTLMKGWNKFLEVTPGAKLRAAEVILLKLDLKARMLSATPFAEHELAQADEEYYRLEKQFEGSPHVQVVRVRADSAENLKRAYPNFYLNTTKFMSAVQQAIGT